MAGAHGARRRRDTCRITWAYVGFRGGSGATPSPVASCPATRSMRRSGTSQISATTT